MVKLFSGTASLKLSQEVFKQLKKSLSKSEVVRFDNSEVRVTIQEKVKGLSCAVIQSTSNPTDTHLIELFLFADALKRLEAKKIIGIIPYFGYARQNIQHRPGECISANVIIRFLEIIGFNEIYTINLHDEATEGIFTIPFHNLNAIPLLAKSVYQYLLTNKQLNKLKTVIVSPDQGGAERAQQFADAFYQHDHHKNNIEVAVIEKKRNLDGIHQSKAIRLFGNVKNKVVILVDDMITSGGTLVHAAQLCLKKGAKNVITAVVHHDFSPNAAGRLQDSPIEKVFVTNTIELKPRQKFSKLKEISIAGLIADQIKN